MRKGDRRVSWDGSYQDREARLESVLAKDGSRSD